MQTGELRSWDAEGRWGMGLDTLWDFGGQKWLGTMGCFELGRIQELRAGWALRDSGCLVQPEM